MISVNRRILVVDDNPDIHSDFKKILGASKKKETRLNLRAIEEQLFADEETEEEVERALLDSVSVEYEIDSAFQGQEAIEMTAQAQIEGKPYALIFMDVRMPPGIDGIETISLIWQSFPNVEMVICTAYSDYSFEEIVEKLGTSDRLLFLTKPFDSIAVKQMALSLTRKWTLHEEARRHVLRLQEEIDQRKASEARLHHLIHHDILTSLPNRNQLQISLADAIRQARENNTRFALFFIDLNRFHEVIDTLGHQNGDQLIKLIADRLTARFDNRGSVFCQAGNEFSLLVPEIMSMKHAAKVAGEIQTVLEPQFDLSGLNIEIQANIGIVIYPDHGSNIDMLMRHADMTLAHAKNTEKGYRFFQETMNLFSPQRLMLLSDLREAIANEDLILYYQPKVNLETEKIFGVEALIRWPHSSHGFISPAKFMPLAERSGVIKQLTAWVLRHVPYQWHRWCEAGLDLRISINLTGYELKDPGLPGRIKAALEPHQMPLDRLAIEVSERGMMEDPEQATHILGTLCLLAEMGCTVVIDNFGTGYSSLSYLKTLPAKEIKIDRSFLDQIGEHSNEMAIVRSMIDLGHNLEMKVLAEGVGSGRVYRTLKDFRCDYLQGPYINHAVPSGELLLWLGESRWAVEPST